MKFTGIKITIATSAIITVTALCSFYKINDAGNNQNENAVTKWFPQFDFDAAAFKKAPREYGPFTRWWWPGNDVTTEELQREINLFANNGFAGVEVEPFAIAFNSKGPQEQIDRQLSWDSPSFYEHVRAVMEQAKQSGVIVDMNAGSGWPMGGPQVTPDSSILTLAYSDTLVSGGKQISMPIPPFKPDNSLKGELVPGWKLFEKIDDSYAKFQAVVAAKFIKKEANQTYLDETSVQDLTGKIVDGKIAWQAPQGEWEIISFWSVPDGELPKVIASKTPGFVADPLDSTIIKAAYQHLFGQRTGLQQYYGNPFRAVFNDSYEFFPNRHYAQNFITYFKQQRGYDITAYLPVNMQKMYNNAYASFMGPGKKPDFVMGDEDWRLRYDYDATVSDLMRSQFIETSNHWMEEMGLLHRTQAYGVKMDIIGNSGAANIPETEQLAGENSEGFVKLVTSGAHLNNKPVVTQESFVFSGRAEMTTPQKIKILADKSFASGVNEIIYHGSPYKYQTGEYGKEGWNPFSSAYLGATNFSSTINESSPFWKNVKSINEYIARTQYALRAGKPHTDVLIYFPFINLAYEQIANNPGEILHAGYFKGVEPKEPAKTNVTDTAKKDLALQWYTQLWSVVNKLEADGVTWEFVNDASLQNAMFIDDKINVNGNKYQSLILPNVPYIQKASAQKINDLTKKGAKLLVVGNAPAKQPSYLNWKDNDAKTKQLIEDALIQKNAKQIQDASTLANWVKTLTQKIKFNDNYNFTRTIDREMSDGSLIKFIWNKSDQWQNISLTVDPSYTNIYWLNAENGTITKASVTTSETNCVLQPYGALILYATKNKLSDSLLSVPVINTQNATVISTIERWNIKTGDASVNNSKLFDWRTDSAFKYKSDIGVYTANFNLNSPLGAGGYFIDLGTVYFTADIFINDKHAGEKIWAPYQLDITPFIQSGTNKIEVRITPTSRNEFIGEGIKGNTKYAQFKGQEKTLMPAGLVGPVKILIMKSNQ